LDKHNLDEDQIRKLEFVIDFNADDIVKAQRICQDLARVIVHRKYNIKEFVASHLNLDYSSIKKKEEKCQIINQDLKNGTLYFENNHMEF